MPMPSSSSLPRVRRQASIRKYAPFAGAIAVAVSAFLVACRALHAAPPTANPAATTAKPTDAQVAMFETKVRPILAAQCLACHGPTQQSAGIRFDMRDGFGKALTPGDPDRSKLIVAMRYKGDVQMPPSGKRPDAEIATLAAWIRAGAPLPTEASFHAASAGAGAAADAGLPANWEQRKRHWAFQPVRRPAVPAVPKGAAWSGASATPIDRFLLAGMMAKGLRPTPPADRRTLIRRAYFDLVGLPPTPTQIDAFVNDHAPDAWGRVVDGLLASPHFGERWGRHWLDVARYADSNGLDENVAFGSAWRYRDYVVHALNVDKPYDQFIREQVAGDLMDSGDNDDLRNERLTATGFLTLGPKVLAEPDKAKMAMDIVDEQIDVTSKAVMGLTVTCARCHDHKFDPISTRDYYAMAGVFLSTRTMVSLNTVAHVYERKLDSATLEASITAHKAQVAPLAAAYNAAWSHATADLEVSLRKDSDRYLTDALELAHTPGVLLPLADTPEKPGDPVRQTILATSFVRGNAVRDNDNYGKGLGVIVTDTAPVSAEWDVSVPTAGPYQLELRYAAQESRPVHIFVNGMEVSKNAAGDLTGSWMPESQRWEAEGIYAFAAGVNHVKIERTEGPLPHISRLLIVAASADAKPASRAETDRVAAAISKRDNLLPAILIRCAARTYGANDLAAAKARAEGDSSLFLATEKAESFWSADDRAAVKKAQDALDAANRAIPMVPMTQAVEETMKPEDTRVHIRGSTENLGDVVPRGFPAILISEHTATVAPNASGRLEMARWLTDPAHPLTGRVAVNRVWGHLFGVGLVDTPDNFGLRGDLPSNPALLDYLASTFTHEDAWSLKTLIRQIMMTQAYRQSSVVAPPDRALLAKIDPENRLLSHANRRRLEAEPYRDSLLAVSGQLDPSVGGTLLTTNDGDYVTNDQSHDNAAYAAPRRSVYLPVIRNSLFDMFQVFDFGDASTVNGQRAVTVVAPQALFALNSPLIRDAADHFATALLADRAIDDGTRLHRAYRHALGRAATPAEVTRAMAYLAHVDAALAPTEPDAARRKQAAWQSLCQALFASNEFLYVE